MIKLSLGVKKLGEKMLNETDEIFEKLMDYMENLKEQERLMFVYLFSVKLLSCFDEDTIKLTLEKLATTKWKDIK